MAKRRVDWWYDVGDDVGGYEVLRCIGEGGYGQVYEVRDPEDGTSVAIKICTHGLKASKRRFAREIRIMEAIDHPHVMPVLVSKLEHDPPFFVMLLAETTLVDDIENSSFCTLDAKLDAFEAICEGAQAVHSAGAVHRDIKPSNVLKIDDRYVLSDLGAAKLDDRDTTILTDTHHVLGTRAYMAPEQLLPTGTREADARTDVFALGCTLYELLTGESPLLIEENKIDPALEWIIEKATQKSPTNRFQNVGELLDAIKGFRRARDPELNPIRSYDALLAEATSLLAIHRKYRRSDLKQLVELLLRIGEQDDEELLERVEAFPEELLRILARILAVDLARLLERYSKAVRHHASDRSFSYAETVGNRMMMVFMESSDPRVRTTAAQATLIAAVKLNRFAAMSTFDAMMLETEAGPQDLAMAKMLRHEREYYRGMANRVPAAKLPPGVRDVRDEVLIPREQPDDEGQNDVGF